MSYGLGEGLRTRGTFGLPYPAKKSKGCGTGVRSRLPRWEVDAVPEEEDGPGGAFPRLPLPPFFGSIGNGSRKMRECAKSDLGVPIWSGGRVSG